MSVLSLLTHFTNALGVYQKSPNFEMHISFHVISGSLTFCLDAPESGSFTVNIYDSAMNFLGAIITHKGITSLPSLPEGRYYYKLMASDGSVVKKGKFNVV